MKAKPRPPANLEVRLRNRRGDEIGKAIGTDILPICDDRGHARIERVATAEGVQECYIADVKRLTETQLDRLAHSLARKYADESPGAYPREWQDTGSMRQVIKNFGFTVPITDCTLVVRTIVTQANFLDLAQPVERDDQ